MHIPCPSRRTNKQALPGTVNLHSRLDHRTDNRSLRGNDRRPPLLARRMKERARSQTPSIIHAAPPSSRQGDRANVPEPSFSSMSDASGPHTPGHGPEAPKQPTPGASVHAFTASSGGWHRTSSSAPPGSGLTVSLSTAKWPGTSPNELPPGHTGIPGAVDGRTKRQRGYDDSTASRSVQPCHGKPPRPAHRTRAAG